MCVGMYTHICKYEYMNECTYAWNNDMSLLGIYGLGFEFRSAIELTQS